ncbi:hypothetical protein [Scytonema sp. NUACC21]
MTANKSGSASLWLPPVVATAVRTDRVSSPISITYEPQEIK